MISTVAPNPCDPEALLPHQAQFFDQFLADELGSPHLLVGPSGSGKTFVAAAILAAELETSPNPRILLVVPLSEAVQYQTWLFDAGRATNIRWLDYRAFREMEAEASREEGPWSNPGIYAMSEETAAKEQVHLSLLAQTWDLMILNDARVLLPEGSSSGGHGQKQLPSGDVRKTLLVSSQTQTRQLETTLKRLRICEWAVPLSDLVGNPWPPDPILIDRTFSPNDSERAFRDKVYAFAITATQDVRGKFVVEQLTARAHSSPLAIETALRRLQSALKSTDPQLAWLRAAAGLMDTDASSFHWNPQLSDSSNLEHKAVWNDLDTMVRGLIEPTSENAKPIWKDFNAAVKELDRLLADFDEIFNDPKLGVLLELVRELRSAGGGNCRRICIFTSFKVTASYLSSAVGENLPGVLTVTSDSSFSDMWMVLETYNSNGGVLVASSVSVAGLDLSSSDVSIHYDLPLSPEEFQTRIARAPHARNVRLVEALQ